MSVRSAGAAATESRLARILPGATTVALGILAWKGLSLFFLPVVLPGPLALLDRMVEIYGDPASFVVVGRTMLEIVEGFALSMLVGTVVGLVMGLKRTAEIFFDSWIMVLLTIPAVCWAFLSVLWFGLSSVAPVITVVLIVTPYVAMNIWQGAKAVDRNLSEMGRVYRADRRLMLRRVLIPQLMPYIFSSLRICLSLSWKIALTAEAFGATSGVGQEMINWFQDTRVDMMLAWGVSFMLAMVLVDLLIFRLWAQRAFAWRRQLAT